MQVTETTPAETTPAQPRPAEGALRRFRRRWGDQLAAVLLPALALAGALGLWEWWVRYDKVPRYIMAPFSGVAKIAWEKHHTLISQAWVTLGEALLGFTAAIAVRKVA